MDSLFENIRNLSADYGEIHYDSADVTNIVYSRDEVEAVNSSRTSSGNVRALVGNGWGFSSFNQADFDSSIDAAVKNARLTKTGNKVLKELSNPVVADISTEYKDDPANYTLKEKNEMIRSYNEALKDPKIDYTKAIYRDIKVTRYFVNTEGSRIKQEKLFTGIALMAMAKDGMNIQRASYSVGQYGGMELVLNQEEQAESVKKRAIDLLSAPKVEAGKYRTLINPKLAGVFAHEAFGHLSEADFLAENPRMVEVMRMGRQFGPDYLNIIDDGSLAGLAGYTPYDDEGVPGKRTYLIKNGKLNARLHSRETAARMDEELSGNGRALTPFHQPIVRMTNTFIDNGDQSFEDLLSQVDDGIYVCDALGGMTNLEMFTFSSAYAYRIKNGQIKEMVRDAVLSGNVFATLQNVSGVANDLQHYGGLGGCGKSGQSGLPVSTGSPHILIDDVLIGGQ